MCCDLMQVGVARRRSCSCRKTGPPSLVLLESILRGCSAPDYVRFHPSRYRADFCLRLGDRRLLSGDLMRILRELRSIHMEFLSTAGIVFELRQAFAGSGATMRNRACVVGKVSRVLLISAALVSGFGLEGQAQTFGAVEGQLTSIQGKINFPFFYGRTDGSPCDPFVDYNCEVSEGNLKAAREHDLRLSGHSGCRRVAE